MSHGRGLKTALMRYRWGYCLRSGLSVGHAHDLFNAAGYSAASNQKNTENK